MSNDSELFAVISEAIAVAILSPAEPIESPREPRPGGPGGSTTFFGLDREGARSLREALRPHFTVGLARAEAATAADFYGGRAYQIVLTAGGESSAKLLAYLPGGDWPNAYSGPSAADFLSGLSLLASAPASYGHPGRLYLSEPNRGAFGAFLIPLPDGETESAGFSTGYALDVREVAR